ncbi:MAG: hypothetical protein GC190_10855 [Alphaproteobacteria bacterium]|nr:hypothetical protein [Alphaproteobacteria bacterium]
MKIRLHHIKYAAARSLWFPVMFAVFIAVLAVAKGVDAMSLLVDTILVVSGTAVIFLYFIWRTQRRLPVTNRKPPRQRKK